MIDGDVPVPLTIGAATMSVNLRRDTPVYATAVDACAAGLSNESTTDARRLCVSQVTAYLYNNRRRSFQLVRTRPALVRRVHRCTCDAV